MVRGNRRGFTLIEALIVVAIVGTIALIGPRLFTQISRFFILSQARVQLQEDARNAMMLITRNLRQAQYTTIKIDQATSQPYYSRIAFTKMQGTTVSYAQSGTKLIQTVNGKTSTLTRDLSYMAFTFPRSDDMTIVSVSMTLEKSIYQGLTKALHMASEKVQVMN